MPYKQTSQSTLCLFMISSWQRWNDCNILFILRPLLWTKIKNTECNNEFTFFSLKCQTGQYHNTFKVLKANKNIHKLFRVVLLLFEECMKWEVFPRWACPNVLDFVDNNVSQLHWQNLYQFDWRLLPNQTDQTDHTVSFFIHILTHFFDNGQSIQFVLIDLKKLKSNRLWIEKDSIKKEKNCGVQFLFLFETWKTQTSKEGCRISSFFKFLALIVGCWKSFKFEFFCFSKEAVHNFGWWNITLWK